MHSHLMKNLWSESSAEIPKSSRSTREKRKTNSILASIALMLGGSKYGRIRQIDHEESIYRT